MAAVQEVSAPKVKKSAIDDETLGLLKAAASRLSMSAQQEKTTKSNEVVLYFNLV